eukprot:5129841-Amphidinium_carterae.1
MPPSSNCRPEVVANMAECAVGTRGRVQAEVLASEILLDQQLMKPLEPKMFSMGIPNQASRYLLTLPAKHRTLF